MTSGRGLPNLPLFSKIENRTELVERIVMTAIAEPRAASLYYRNGSSDKEYHVRLEARDVGFVVNYAYGRRGSALSTGTKTNTPVDHAAASRIFDKLVNDKQAKGYTAGLDGTPYQHTNAAGQVSGLLPQLLNVADEADVARLVNDPAWCMQQKFDGRRLMLRKSGDSVEAINKLGLVVGAAEPIVAAAHSLPGDFILDGEVIGDRLFVFDLLGRGGDDLRDMAYRERYAGLVDLLAGSGPHISFVDSWAGAADKARLLANLKAGGAEGVVFKLWDAPFTPGRPNRGGPQLKFKFVATLSALVTTINTQRSVGLSLLGENGWQPVGNVTIPANHDVPSIGAVVEVRYLYAAPALVQPVYLGERSDVEPPECVTAQLKFKTT